MKRVLTLLVLLAFLACCRVTFAQAVGDFQILKKVNETGPFSAKNFAGGNSKIWGTDGSGNPVSLTLGTGLSNDGANLALDSDLVTWAGVTSSANGRSLVSAADYAAMKVLLSLGNVEDTALSTWAGSGNVATVGTVTSGTWQGSVIAPAYLGTGSSISTKFLRGDGTWQAVDLSGYQSLSGTLALAGFGAITGTLPVANGGTGITSLGSGVATWLGAPSSANLAGALTDETGSGAAVFAASPTLTGVMTVSDGSSYNPIVSSGTGQNLVLRGGSYWGMVVRQDNGWVYFGYAIAAGSDPGNVGSVDAWIMRRGGAHWGLGLAASSPVTQTFGGAEGAGTDITGGDLIIGTRGTGSGTGGSIHFKSHESGSSGATPGTLVTRMSVTPSGVSIGGGPEIKKVLHAVAMDEEIGPIDEHATDIITVTVTEAEVGDSVAVGVSDDLVGGTMMFFGWVSAADTVSIRAANIGPTPQGAFTGDVEVTVFQH